MKKSLSFAVAALTLVACTDPAKVPAEAAVQAADAAVASLTDLARTYMPAETQALQQTVAGAKDLLAKKDYKSALAAAREVPAKAAAVLAAAHQKYGEIMTAWSAASGPLPSMIAAIKGRLEGLVHAKKLPDGVQKTALDEAQAGVAALESGFAEAQALATGGDLQAATAKARDLQPRALEIMRSLAMNLN